MSSAPSEIPVQLLPLDEHNLALRANSAPPGWHNPSPTGRYNLVVIGGGTAGLVAAAGAAGLGARVALVERTLLGGDCLTTGCVPSKALIRSARAAHDARSGRDFGISAGGVEVDFTEVMTRLRRLRAQISPHDSAARFRDLGIDVYLGEASFIGPTHVRVAGQDLAFARAVIATGGRAAIPDIPGLAEVGYLTNESIFSLTRRPARLAVIGGGPIGCELAQAFQRLGSRVHLIQSAGRILPHDDADAAVLLERAMRADGVSILTSAQVTGARRESAGRILAIRSSEGTQEVEVDEILVAAGRRPNLERLGLDAAGVTFDLQHGVTVDDRLRTSNRRIYAAGDVCSRFKFTHAADAMARIVLNNALFFGRASASALTMPWCTYTDPEIAHVGLSQEEALARGMAIDTIRVPFHEVDRAILDGEQGGLLTIHLRKGSDRILGATIVARHAGEMIAEITLAMTAGLGLRAIGRTIHPYPTQAEAIRKAADQYNRRRLTPFIKQVFQRWMQWLR